MDLLAEVQKLKEDNGNLQESLSQKKEHCDGLNVSYNFMCTLDSGFNLQI